MAAEVILVTVTAVMVEEGVLRLYAIDTHGRLWTWHQTYGWQLFGNPVEPTI